MVRAEQSRLEKLEAALADRDVQIAELQQAIVEVANKQEARPVSDDLAAGESIAAVEARLAALEARLIEQERTIRHTLTMLIEMIEAEGAARVAA
jgi:uncharacterized coiled-coil protein SlyX